MALSGSSVDWDLLSSYAGLLTLATGSIYAGSFGTLSDTDTDSDSDSDSDTDGKAKKKKKKKKSSLLLLLDERMSSSEAWFFPVIGSGTLLGLYVCLKYFGAAWINWLLGHYFAVTGVASVWRTLISLTRFALGETRWKTFETSQLLFLTGTRVSARLSWKTPSLFLLPLGALPSALYALSRASRRSALLTDVLSLSFAHTALTLLKIDGFRTGCILLAGLFVYDVWWVFGTEVMVKVATTLDAPIKLLWPKSMVFSPARGFTMLGLGDIVVPGTFIALALRYDHHRARRAGPASSFAKPYFHAALGAYVAGLATTIAVMHVFGKAQPALLYLSPACIVSFLVTALVRGELRDAWDWSDYPSAREDGDGDGDGDGGEDEDLGSASEIGSAEDDDPSDGEPGSQEEEEEEEAMSKETS